MLKKITKTCCVVALLLLGTAANAGNATAKIEQILLYEDGNLLYVYPAGGVQSAPACHNRTNGDYFTISMARPMAKQYLAALMTAQAMGYVVVLSGTNVCNEQSFAESLSYLRIIKQ